MTRQEKQDILDQSNPSYVVEMVSQVFLPEGEVVTYRLTNKQNKRDKTFLCRVFPR